MASQMSLMYIMNSLLPGRWYTRSERSPSVDRKIDDRKLIRSGRPVHMKELLEQYHLEKERKMADHERWENTFLHDLDR